MGISPAHAEAADLLARARTKVCLDPDGLRDVPCEKCERGRGDGKVAACPMRRAEISAIQSQLIKMAKDPSEDHRNWRAEYQGEPRPPETRAVVRIGAANVIEARSELPQKIVPADAEIIVQGRDVGRHEIHTTVMAISPGRVCRVIDYYMENVESPTGHVDRSTPEGKAKQLQIEAAIKAALTGLMAADSRTTFARADGQRVGISLTVYDSRFAMAVVRECCFEAGIERHMPVMGMGSAKSQQGRRWSIPRAIETGAKAARARDRIYRTRDGNTYSRWVSLGPRAPGGKDRLVLSLYAHSDWYKTNVHAGFFLQPGEPGSISIFDPVDERTGEILAGALHSRYHARYAAHITAEQEEEVVPGSALTHWVKVKGREANHYFDATYLCLVAVSILESLIAPEIRLREPAAAPPAPAPAPAAATATENAPPPVLHRTIDRKPKKTNKQKRSKKSTKPARRSFRRTY